MYDVFIIIYLDGQNCINNPDIDRPGSNTFLPHRQVIIPSMNFNCNGRITSVAASIDSPDIFGIRIGDTLPVFQVWHPQTPGSNIYSVIGQVQFQLGTLQSRGYFNSVVSLTGDNRIEFQAGDVIGYYHPSNPIRVVGIIISNYISYAFSFNNLTTINISNYNGFQRQPLISVMTGEFILTIAIAKSVSYSIDLT